MEISEVLDPVFGLEPAATACPYPSYALLREKQPVMWVESIGAYAVTRYADVQSILRNPELFSNRMPVGPTGEVLRSAVAAAQAADPELGDRVLRIGTPPAVLLRADPPQHSRQRRLVNRAFTPRRVTDLEPDIEELAHQLIDHFEARGQAEFVSEFAVGLPLTIIARLLGVSDEMLSTFKHWADVQGSVIGNSQFSAEDARVYLEVQLEFWAYFEAEFNDRRANPRDDLLTDIVTARDGQLDPLTNAELVVLMEQVLGAGHETSTKLISSGVLHMCRHPEIVDDLRNKPERIATFVEEMLRLEPPVQGLFRVTTEDVVVAGVPIPSDSFVWLAYASANRDQNPFDSPDDVDLHRENARDHLSFGGGPHFCLGAALARLEARIAFEAVVTRLSDLRLEDEVSLEYVQSFILHGIKALPVTFRSRSGVAPRAN